MEISGIVLQALKAAVFYSQTTVQCKLVACVTSNEAIIHDRDF